MTKICSKCNLDKDISRFSLEKKNKEYYRRNVCKNCRYKSADKNKKRIRDNRFNKKRAKTPEYRAWRRQYERTRYCNDIQYRLSDILRSRLKIALKNNAKKGKTLDYLGCSIVEFKNYLELKFLSGMSWENQGSVWHIDHIKPLAKFDLSKEEEIIKACHYTNLQPLLAFENLSKGAKYESDI